MIDHGAIATLLDDSRQAHQVYRENLHRRIQIPGNKTMPIPGDLMAAGAALWRACRARAEAHVLDPQRESPAWQDEPQTHDHSALLDFYVQQMTR